VEGFDRQFVGREEVNEIEEIAQISEVKESENGIEAGLDRARSTIRSTGGGARSTAQSTGVHDVHRHGPVDRPIDRGRNGRPPGLLTDMSQLSVGPGRPDWSTEHRID